MTRTLVRLALALAGTLALGAALIAAWSIAPSAVAR